MDSLCPYVLLSLTKMNAFVCRLFGSPKIQLANKLARLKCQQPAPICCRAILLISLWVCSQLAKCEIPVKFLSI